MGPKPCSSASSLKDRAGDKEETRGVLGDEGVPSSTQAVVVGGCKETWGCLGWSQGSHAPSPTSGGQGSSWCFHYPSVWPLWVLNEPILKSSLRRVCPTSPGARVGVVEGKQ